MTTIAIVVGSVFAYVVVAGRMYRYLRETQSNGNVGDQHGAAILWILYLTAVALRWLLLMPWRLGATPRRRSKLPEARVRR